MKRIGLILIFLVCGILFTAISSTYSDASAAAITAGKKKKKDKKSKKKKKPKKKKVKSNCDPASLIRTSGDSLILKKYVTTYRTLGGVCYIRHLQKLGKLEQTDEGHFYIEIGKSKSAQDRADWQTYLYCPIGKPNGMVALVAETGDTIQLCSYQNERKEGFMYWLKPRYGIVSMAEFVNDEPKVKKVSDYDPNAGQ